MIGERHIVFPLHPVIGVPPCTGIRLPDRVTAEPFIPSPEQVHALAAAMPDHYRALVYVGAGLGLRIGEASGLEVEHVDFLRREVRVVQQLATVSRPSAIRRRALMCGGT